MEELYQRDIAQAVKAFLQPQKIRRVSRQPYAYIRYSLIVIQVLLLTHFALRIQRMDYGKREKE